MNKIKKAMPWLMALAPGLVLAANDVQGIITLIMSILNLIVPLLIAVAVVIFLYGVIKYITAGGDETKRTEARNMMLWGIIGLFVMIAVWGLVNVLANTLDLDTSTPDVPDLP